MYQTFLDSKKLADAKQIYSENVIEKQDVKVEQRNSFADKNPSQEKGVFGSESNFVSSKGSQIKDFMLKNSCKKNGNLSGIVMTYTYYGNISFRFIFFQTQR